MLLFVLAYAAGVLTILSPCILPVLPFVFARSDRPFLRSGLPLLLAMIATFAIVASLASVVGGWAVAANQYGRYAALLLLAGFGLALLFPSIAQRVMQPFVALGNRLTEHADGSGIGASLLLGVATGLLWAPCAGPVLGLILTGAALQGANATTSVLLIAYAAGAATSLALALLVGGKMFSAMKRSLGAGEWIRRGLGALVLVAVVAIGLGADTGLLRKLSLASTNSLEQHLLDQLHPIPRANANTMPDGLGVEGQMPSLDGATQWLNSAPLSADALRGKVVLVDFWTYSCINCLRSLPYVKAWAEKYRDQGLVVIGVHAPEFAFERDVDNVRKATVDLGVTYPVALDNERSIWRAFDNHYWPAHYFIDTQGRIRHHHFGEGDYAASEKVIQQLLAEGGAAHIADDFISVKGRGVEAAPDRASVNSPETYIGYERAEHFISPGGFEQDARKRYAMPQAARLNEWGLSGAWRVGEEHAQLDAAGGSIVYRFHARDLHLVLGPPQSGKSVRFIVTIDGKPPQNSSGVDVDASGAGVVTEQRLYQLLRQQGDIADRTFEIRFLDPGVQAYAFTFG